MCQYTTFSPCLDTISYTRGGKEIKTPEFWNCFHIAIDSTNIIIAVEYLNLMYGGTLIEYAEFEFNNYFDSTPNDYSYTNNPPLQTNFDNTLIGENIVEAWDIEHGKREIKVGVFDSDILYTHRDFGGAMGPQYRFINGAYFDNFGGRRPPFNGGTHGTKVAGIIGAMTNNEIDAAGIAGGWNPNEGVSMYALGGNMAEAFIYASANTSGNQGYGVHLISNSTYNMVPSETERRAIDYAHRLNVGIYCSKGDDGEFKTHFPADFEYNKIVNCGAYGIYKEFGGQSQENRWIPSRFKGYSNFGYGLDIMAHGDNISNGNLIRNNTLTDPSQNSGYYTGYFSQTSAAQPQVAGIGALILSKFYTGLNNFWDNTQNEQLVWLAPEDVEGLIEVSAKDLKYFYSATQYDTVGFDSETGYGMIEGGNTLRNMLNPYKLVHFKENGGEIVNSELVNPFLVATPYSGDPLLPPTSNNVLYYAIKHKVQKSVIINGNWVFARAWGRGGDGTIGWSAAQPTEPSQNSNLQVGWCRVVGDNLPNRNDFNYNNIRDISYRNDRITLETYCYQVYNANNNSIIGWYPTTPDQVVYNFTIWGIPILSEVLEQNFNIDSEIKINCKYNNIIGKNFVQIEYYLPNPAPSKIELYNSLGIIVAQFQRNEWNDDLSNLISIDVSEFPSGLYIVKVSSNNSFGFNKFILTK
jgi:serine protease